MISALRSLQSIAPELSQGYVKPVRMWKTDRAGAGKGPEEKEFHAGGSINRSRQIHTARAVGVAGGVLVGAVQSGGSRGWHCVLG